MSTFIVSYRHPDYQGWLQHLKPHMDWIMKQVESGCLIASGPVVGAEDRSAVLVFSAQDNESLREIIATDPYYIEGLVADLKITQWDPIFGTLRSHSSEMEYDDILRAFNISPK